MSKKKPEEKSPWAALDALLKVSEEPMGAEWFTPKQFAERYGLSSVGSASNKLRKLKDDGKLEGWIGMSRERHRRVAKYRIKPA